MTWLEKKITKISAHQRFLLGDMSLLQECLIRPKEEFLIATENDRHDERGRENAD